MSLIGSIFVSIAEIVEVIVNRTKINSNCSRIVVIRVHPLSFPFFLQNLLAKNKVSSVNECLMKFITEIRLNFSKFFLANHFRPNKKRDFNPSYNRHPTFYLYYIAFTLVS